MTESKRAKSLHIFGDMPQKVIFVSNGVFLFTHRRNDNYWSFVYHLVVQYTTTHKENETMAINAGIFGDKTSFEHRYIPDHEKLEELVGYWKKLGLRIILTSGTFDLFHIGHALYLEKAKELGDVLIVGVDSDEKVKQRKGPNRPIVPENERVLILSHVRHADVITLKNVNDPSNHLIKLVQPDVLVVSKSTKHKDCEVDEKAQYCGQIVLLEPQAQTSTSAKLRLIQISKDD